MNYRNKAIEITMFVMYLVIAVTAAQEMGFFLGVSWAVIMYYIILHKKEDN